MKQQHLPDLLERLARLDTSTLSDALDVAGIDGVVTGLGPVWRCGSLAGRAVTVCLVPVDGSVGAKHHLGAAAIESSGPGDVIVVDNQGRTEMGGWGGLLARAAAAGGVEGVVVDGACRDVDEMEEIGLPMFARGATARTARGRVVEQPATEIQVAGVRVRQGDFVRADRTAVVFIPAADANDIISAAEAISLREDVMARALSRGYSPTSVLGADYEDLLSQMASDGSVDA